MGRFFIKYNHTVANIWNEKWRQHASQRTCKIVCMYISVLIGFTHWWLVLSFIDIIMNYDIRARCNKLRMYIYMLDNTIIFIVIYELVYSTEDENIFGNL